MTPVTHTPAAELLDAVRERWSVSPAEVLRLVTDQWRGVAARTLCAEDAESCRQAMLAAGALQKYAVAGMWKARALARFAALDWREGVAAILMVDVFKVLAVAHEGYPEGTTFDVLRPCPEALAIMDELRPFAEQGGRPHDFGPDAELLTRFRYEKTGFLLAVAGRFDDAEQHYEQALKHVLAEPRGQVKVRAGLELVRYLRDLAQGGSGTVAFAATEALAADPLMRRFSDMAAIADVNVERMREGGRNVLPYELL